MSSSRLPTATDRRSPRAMANSVEKWSRPSSTTAPVRSTTSTVARGCSLNTDRAAVEAPPPKSSTRHGDSIPGISDRTTDTSHGSRSPPVSEIARRACPPSKRVRTATSSASTRRSSTRTSPFLDARRARTSISVRALSTPPKIMPPKESMTRQPMRSEAGIGALGSSRPVTMTPRPTPMNAAPPGGRRRPP